MLLFSSSQFSSMTVKFIHLKMKQFPCVQVNKIVKVSVKSSVYQNESCCNQGRILWIFFLHNKWLVSRGIQMKCKHKSSHAILRSDAWRLEKQFWKVIKSFWWQTFAQGFQIDWNNTWAGLLFSPVSQSHDLVRAREIRVFCCALRNVFPS